ILAIHDVGTDADRLYAVMELLDGKTLRERLEHGPLSWRKAVEVAAAIAAGLAAAHDKGIIHRDVTPANVFMTTDGFVKILDFGLARYDAIGESDVTRPRSLTEAGVVMGTTGYMSPEQVRGLSIDSRTDIFSLGAVLYEMVSGRRAFTG